MEGSVAPLARLVDLTRRHAALFVVDEAHAAGVLGPAGVGLAAGLGAHLQMGTLGKAFGVSGAYAAGPGWDACSGLGSPDGASLAGLLTAHAPAAPSVAKKKAATKKKKSSPCSTRVRV